MALPPCNSTWRAARSMRCTRTPGRQSRFRAAKASGLNSAVLSGAAVPASTALDSGGRSCGGCGSSPSSTMRPAQPSCRKVWAAQPPAWPAPMMTMVSAAQAGAAHAAAATGGRWACMKLSWKGGGQSSASHTRPASIFTG